MNLRIGDTVKSPRWPGVALFFAGFKTTPIIDEFGWDDEEIDETTAIVVMVGDDHRMEASVEDLTLIHDDEFCSGCGQIGCHANG